MTKPVSIALVAVGGYGNFYVSSLLDKTDPGLFDITGIVDPVAQRSPRIGDLKSLNIPIYESLGEFYARHSAQLAIVSSPIHLHCQQSCEALENGSNVLCEKPLGATIQEAARMITQRDRAGKFVGIGYQWSFSAAIQALKKDIIAGHLGKPLRLKTIVLWPRAENYYQRNNWAGALQDAKGNWILDSPVNNATAHYLHNMLYLIGDRIDRSARPVRVTAELYRANDIANYDTGIARILTAENTEVLYYASHAVENSHGPEFLLEFEQASVSFGDRGQTVVARFRDGTVKDYGNPSDAPHTKLWDAMDAVHGKKDIVCTPEAASAQTLVMNGMQESVPDIVTFPAEFTRLEGEQGKRLTFVGGLDDTLLDCYRNNQLPSERNVEWAVAGQSVDLTSYTEFPQHGQRTA